jgi:hypothetical protein
MKLAIEGMLFSPEREGILNNRTQFAAGTGKLYNLPIILVNERAAQRKS